MNLTRIGQCLIALVVGFALGALMMTLSPQRAADLRAALGAVPGADAAGQAGIAPDEGGDNDAAETDADDDIVAVRVVYEQGRRAIRLNESERRLATVKAAELASGSVIPERRARGIVADDGILMGDWRAVARARRRVATQNTLLAAITRRVAALERLAAGGQIAVQRELAERETQRLVAADEVSARALELERLDEAMRARWGAALVAALTAQRPLVDDLGAQRARLIVFAAPEAHATTVLVSADGTRERASAGAVIGPAPQALGVAPGATWYAIVRNADLRRNMRVDVWIQEPSGPRPGLILPRSAVVWHGGHQWYFIEFAPDTYARRRLPAALEHPAGWLLEPGIATEPVVIQGAQVLLAEEFRGAIPDEDDD